MMNGIKVFSIGKIVNKEENVCIILDPGLASSCRMLKKCGYAREGLIRQGKMVNTWCDCYIYGILSSDITGDS